LVSVISGKIGIKESYFNSTVTFPFIKVNSDQTSLQYKRIGCTQALKSLICPYMFILSDNKDLCEKTKVMIFNKSGRKLKGYSFMYAQQSIGQASVYKYLGIIFKPSGSHYNIKGLVAHRH
jgi:hypothetical protein